MSWRGDGGRRMTPETVQAYRLTLPWSRPPLSLNSRMHWSAKHRATAEIRRTVGWLAKAAKIPAVEHCTVQLVWAPGDRRKRETDNLVATQKPCVDSLIDAGVVLDDDPQHVTMLMPVLQPPPAGHGMWFIVMIGRHSPQDFEEFLYGNPDQDRVNR